MRAYFISSKHITHFTLIGMGLIMGASLLVIGFEWLPLEIIIQIATTMMAFLVTAACLLHIYQQHQRAYRKERQLRKQVIEKVHSLCPNLSYHKIAQEQLDLTLEVHGLEQRLKKLARIKANTKALKAFVHQLKWHQASKETLKDLGLSWENKP